MLKLRIGLTILLLVLPALHAAAAPSLREVLRAAADTSTALAASAEASDNSYTEKHGIEFTAGRVYPHADQVAQYETVRPWTLAYATQCGALFRDFTPSWVVAS